MKSSLETEDNFKLYKVELLPRIDNSNSYGNLLEKHKFTGHERDYSTGLDYMHFRFYASAMGRFLKPDNIIPDAFNPQSWNLYTYVNGNPVNFNDPTGHDLRGKQGKMGMSFAFAGVPDVDISGMLTPVEMYEVFGANIHPDEYMTAGEYYRASYSAAQTAAKRGFKFYSPYGYTNFSETPNWAPGGDTSSANDLVFTFDPFTGQAYTNDIALSYQDASILADVQHSYHGRSDLEIGFYYNKLGFFNFDSSDTPGRTVLNSYVLQFHSIYYGHVHPQEGTLINGTPNGMGPSVGDCRVYLYLWENRITTGFIVQRDKQSRLVVYQFHATNSCNLTIFWWSMHYGY